MFKGMSNIYKQAQKMQKDMKKVQDELEDLNVEGQARGGIIKVVVNISGYFFLYDRIKYILYIATIVDHNNREPVEPAHNAPILYIVGVAILLVSATNFKWNVSDKNWLNNVINEIIIIIAEPNNALDPDFIYLGSLLLSRPKKRVPIPINENKKAKNRIEDPKIEIILIYYCLSSLYLESHFVCRLLDTITWFKFLAIVYSSLTAWVLLDL